MKNRRSKSLFAVAVSAGLVVAACGSDEKKAADTTAATTAPTTAASTADTVAAGAGGSLAGICPDLITLQTDWMPEAEHGFVYNMIGDDFTMDAGQAFVTGSLIDATGADTGVDLQIRSGGSPQNFDPVSVIMYNKEDTFLGFVNTDEAIKNSATNPTVAIESGFNKNPQIIMWDPAVYPDVKTITDLGTEGVKIRYFDGGAYMDFLTSTGVLSKDQVDGSYSGDPNLYITDEGKAAQQGYGSAEPWLYEHEYTTWLKPVAYQYVDDLGWNPYAESIATKPENITTYAECFKVLVPIIQQSTVDYLTDPTRANVIINAAVASFGADFGWTYSPATLDYGVKTILADGLVANGPNDTIGNFDTDRVAELIVKAIPVFTAQDSPPKEGLTPEDIITTEFLDPTIGL